MSSKNIQLLDIQKIQNFSLEDHQGIVVIMPCIDAETGIKTAEILYRRAGMPCTILVVLDTLRQGFIKTLNQTAVRITAKYIVYLAQDAWPGRGWLKCAYESLEKSGKGLLAFNDGKWQGRIASFGMVRTSWVKSLYGGDIFYPGYISHAADNEITVIARVQNMHEYNPDCTLMEYDPDKDFGGSNSSDRALFKSRFKEGFVGLAPLEKLHALAREYKVDMDFLANDSVSFKKGVSIIILTLNAAHHLDRFLSSFFKINTFSPVELIIIDHASTDNTPGIVANYVHKGFVRLIKLGQNYSFSDSLKLGAEKAIYPYLLFLNKNIIFNSDILHHLLQKIELDSEVAGTCLSFSLQEKKILLKVRMSDIKNYEISGLICRTSDFLKSKETMERSIGNQLYISSLINSLAQKVGKTKFLLWSRPKHKDRQEFVEPINNLQNTINIKKEQMPSPRRTNDRSTSHLYLKKILESWTAESTYAKKLLEFPGNVFSLDLIKAIQATEEKLTAITKKYQNRRQKPLVSVIMPTWNREDIIGDSIATVIEQQYPNWELFVCDDASTDNTENVVKAFKDSRIHYLKIPKKGAAAARNAGLQRAKGTFIAYLDSDNYWHPLFLTVTVESLLDNPGRSSVYTDFIDFHVDLNSDITIKSFQRPPFNHESLLKKPFIDLNSFVHNRELSDIFGGFNGDLPRRQDYDLILKYTWLRDPLHIPYLLTLYHRNDNLEQITRTQKHNTCCIDIVNRSLELYFNNGLPLVNDPLPNKITIISWDLCRNHFSKPFALAEALSSEYDIQLISFRFFEEEIFQPLQGVEPSFETVYLPGGKFPEFFDSMGKALDAIRGDVIYVVKPRLPSLGLALLANYHKKTPVILEINDLETVISSPKAEDKHQDLSLDMIDLEDKNLLNPYSDIWSQIMDPLAKSLPVLTTHNKNIDAHFGHNCLYMRNIKDEQVYDPGRYERERVRTELGFAKDDRIILFGGMLRKHKGIYELIQLVEKLQDPRYKLLFVGSRPNPDQDELVKKHGDIIKVLPPQDRRSMARINLAADLVILWLNPEVAASHYQMPYKATDALAMQTPIIANDISDLGELGRQGYVRLVPFGDWDNMQKTIKDIFDKPEKTRATTRAGRRLYLRQFSYAAARSNFALAANRALERSFDILPPAEAFTKRFNEFFRHVSGSDKDFGPIPHKQGQQANTLPGKQSYGEAEEDASIVIIDVQHVESINHVDPEGVAVIMPSINMEKALDTARILVKRAGMKTTVFVVEDTLRQGFIKTLNATAKQMKVRYVVYLAEDAFPGVDWLKIAYDKLEETGKGLLAFNCGKWRGRIAAFGMVRLEWVKQLYDGDILYLGYISHRADNELTAIARSKDDFIYLSEAILIEVDKKKIYYKNENEYKNFHLSDKKLFINRFNNQFEGLVKESKLEKLRDEYLNQRKLNKSYYINDDVNKYQYDNENKIKHLTFKNNNIIT